MKIWKEGTDKGRLVWFVGVEMVEENVGMLKSVAGSAERHAIIEVLEKVNHNKTSEAEVLRIDPKTLYNKLRIYCKLCNAWKLAFQP